MEAILSRLQGLSADELRDELLKANLKCGPITATTRAIFERKLARALVSEDASSNGASETDSNNSSSSSNTGTASATNSGTSAMGASDLEPQARCGPRVSSASAESQTSEDSDFGYGMGLNPPEEEALTEKTAMTVGCVRAEEAQTDGQTPTKPAQVSPSFYYGVCPPWEDMLVRTGTTLLTAYFLLLFWVTCESSVTSYWQPCEHHQRID